MTDNERIKTWEKINDILKRTETLFFAREEINDFVYHITNILALINRQKAEIERLEKGKLSIIEHLKKARKQLKTAKAEAVKEFALELKRIPRTWVYKSEIDNLLKEKVGADNG